MKLINIYAKRNLVNLTPLIDIVFILLIFFMLASNFAEWQFIELATGDVEELHVDSQNTSTIKLMSGGGYALDGKEIPLKEIVAIVRERCRANIDHPVIIKLADGVPLQLLVSLLDDINEFAVTNVSLVKVSTN
jgi:biopolymer transport protein ExbD